jgi:hypothetical protein
MSMEEHVRRAGELARAIADYLAREGLPFDHELESYEHVCMVHVDLPDNDGFTFTVARTDPSGWVEILDPVDYHLPPVALPLYVLLRTQGTPPGPAWKAALKASASKRRWYRRRG